MRADHQRGGKDEPAEARIRGKRGEPAARVLGRPRGPGIPREAQCQRGPGGEQDAASQRAGAVAEDPDDGAGKDGGGDEGGRAGAADAAVDGSVTTAGERHRIGQRRERRGRRRLGEGDGEQHEGAVATEESQGQHRREGKCSGQEGPNGAVPVGEPSHHRPAGEPHQHRGGEQRSDFARSQSPRFEKRGQEG